MNNVPQSNIPAPESPPLPIWQRINRITIRPPTFAYLGFLILFSAWGIGNLSLVGRALLICIVYSVIDLGIGYAREGKWIPPISAWISGLILALVLAPTAPTLAVLLAPVLASLSKHFIRVRRKHILNPAAFALVALGVLFPAQGIVSWWGAAWGPLVFVVVAACGLVTMIRAKRTRTALAFMLIYLAGSAILLLTHGAQLADLRTLVLDGTLVFFATVMLIEPVTTAYRPAWLRTVFGVIVALLVLVFSLPQFPFRLPDIFLGALLLGNLLGTVAHAYFRDR